VIFQAIIQLSNVSNVLNEKPRILPNSAIVNALFSSLFIFVCYDALGVRSIGLAIVFGGFIQLLIVAIKSQHYRDSQVKASSEKIDDSGQLPGSIMMLLLLNGLNEFIKIYEKGLSASFGGGVVTMIYYSNKVTLTIASLVLAAVTYLYLPKLSRQESPMKEIRKRILNPRTLSLGLFLFLLTYLSIPLVVNLLFNGQGVFLNEQEFGVISKLSLLSALGYLILNMLTMLQLAEGRKYLAYLPLGLLFVVKMLLYLFTRSILELNAFYVPKIGVISYGISILLCLLIYRLILWKYRL
jgi:peptidoglycan biosynthesis protein MviN/MurJ (putative lipid II flippase)